MIVLTNAVRFAALCFALLAVSVSVHAQSESSSSVDARFKELREEFDRRMADLKAGYESRVKDLEGQVSSLKGRVEETGPSDLEVELGRLVKQEHGDSRWMNHFHNDRNPAVSLTSDFVLSVTDRDDSSNDGNRFIVRELELSIQGHIDDYTTYHLFLFYNEEDIEVEEGYGVHIFDEGRTTGIRAGRFNTPFTPVSRLHSHDLPFVDFPGVVQEFLGGNFRGTGAEIFHRIELESLDLIRFNAGIVNSLDGDSHTVNGPLVGVGHEHDEEEEEFEPFGERSLENFAFYVHGEGRFAVGEDSELRVGTSAAWAPRIETTFLNEIGPTPFEDHGTLKKFVASIDIALQINGDEPGEKFIVAAEAFFNRQQFLDEDTAFRDSESSFGFFVWSEYQMDTDFAFGASFDWFEHAEDSSTIWWDAGVWVTWYLSESNRVHAEFRFFDDGESEEYWGFMLQWVTTLGTHEHVH